jgi:hypothetical protein
MAKLSGSFTVDDNSQVSSSVETNVPNNKLNALIKKQDELILIHEKKLSSQSQIVDDVEKTTKAVESTLEQVKDDVKEIKKQQVRLIEVLGIFFALFTLISMNIQIFSRVSDIASAGLFSILIFCIVVEMIVISDYLLFSKDNKMHRSKHALLGIGTLTLGIVTVGCFYLSKFPLNPIENSPELNGAIDKRISELVRMNAIPFRQKYDEFK